MRIDSICVFVFLICDVSEHLFAFFFLPLENMTSLHFLRSTCSQAVFLEAKMKSAGRSVFKICRCYSVTQSCPTLCDPMDCSTPGFPVLHYLPEFAQTHVHWVSDAIQPSHPLSSPSPTALSLSQQQGCFPVSQFYASGGQSIGISASASVLPVHIQGWLIFFRMDWSDLAVQETLSLWYHDLKAPVRCLSALFMVQLSRPCTATGNTMALTVRTSVGKVTSLLLNILSRFVIASLPRNKHLFISWLQSPSAVIFGAKKTKSVTVFTFSLSVNVCHEVMGPDAIIWVFLMLSFKANFSLSSLTLVEMLFSSSSLSAIIAVSSAYLRLWYFSWQSWFQLVIHLAQHLPWCTLHIS